MLSSQTLNNRSGKPPVLIDRVQRADLCRKLDRLADIELQHGHHATAERLATLADELRSAQR